MSSALGTEEEIGAQLRDRLSRGARQISFLVIPSVAAFLVLGDVVAAAIYQSGRFTHDGFPSFLTLGSAPDAHDSTMFIATLDAWRAGHLALAPC